MDTRFEQNYNLIKRPGLMQNRSVVQNTSVGGFWDMLEPLAFFCLAILYLLMMCVFGVIEAMGIQVMRAQD